MRAVQVREWEYLSVDDSGEGNTVMRSQADGLVAAAQQMRIGGRDGEAILVNGHKRLRAQQVVGVLASANITLEILPKIDGLDEAATRKNLVHMLARVYKLDVSSGALTSLDWQRHDLLEILIALFCDKLFEVARRGLPRRYLSMVDDLPALRGRLDIQRQFTVLAARPNLLACRFEELNADIPLNQMMKAAVSRLQFLARASENQRKLAELNLAFADVSRVSVKELLGKQILLDRTNVAWASVLALARLLLGGRYQTTSSGRGEGFSLLFEMNTLFEEYVARSLMRALAGTEIRVHLQGPQKHALLAATGEKYFATRPDIVIARDGKNELIIDTKWKRLKGPVDDAKRGVGQADVYQMMAYSQVYQCDNLLLLYPHHTEMDAPEGLIDAHHIVGTERARLSVGTVSLEKLQTVPTRLTELVTACLSTTCRDYLAAEGG